MVGIWGWATWRRAWQQYDERLSSWPQLKADRFLNNILPDKRAVVFWTRVFDAMHQGSGAQYLGLPMGLYLLDEKLGKCNSEPELNPEHWFWSGCNAHSRCRFSSHNPCEFNRFSSSTSNGNHCELGLCEAHAGALLHTKHPRESSSQILYAFILPYVMILSPEVGIQCEN